MNTIIKNLDGSFVSVPSLPFDPAAASQEYLEAVAALNLSKTNAEANVQAQISAQQNDVAAKLAVLQSVMAQFPDTAATIQPKIDSASSQFPELVATLTAQQAIQEKL